MQQRDRGNLVSEEKEVIGLLPAEGASGRAIRAQALVRLADGRVVVETLGEEAKNICRSLSRFRPGRPILDPDTREVIGYEMEKVSLAASA
jgi:hypothetical protein